MGGESTANSSEATPTKLTLDPPGFAGAVGDVPLSVRVRERLVNTSRRFHASDNIAAYLRDDELDLFQAEVEERLQAVLRALVIDVEQGHNSRETACRMARMFMREVFAGRYVEVPEVTAFPNAERLNELMMVGPLRVRSACLHHLYPVMGRAWVGVILRQGSQLIGLPKCARLVDWVMSRPQIQEEAIKQITDLLEDQMEPDGLAVVLEAGHYCMRWRSTKDDESRMVSNVMHGMFLTDANLRRGFLALLPGHNGE